MEKIQIYDPPMCCSSGVCGAKVDEKLVEFAGALKTLEKAGVIVERFNMSQRPKAFADNMKVRQILSEQGQNSLPLIFVNNELKWSGMIPSARELLKVFGVAQNTQKISNSGCCSEGCC